MGHDARLNPFARGTRVPDQPMIVRDLYGRSLSEGDGVFLGPMVSPLFKIVNLKPLLAANAPPNMMQITLACTLQFLAPRNQNNNEFIRVMTGLELQQMQGPRGQISVEKPPEDEKAEAKAGSEPPAEGEDLPPAENFYPPDEEPGA
jgi:hypothetical protein